MTADSPRRGTGFGVSRLSNLILPAHAIADRILRAHSTSRDERSWGRGEIIVTRGHTRPTHSHTGVRTQRGHPTHDTIRSPQTHPRAPDPDAQTPSRVRAPINTLAADCALAPPGLAGLFAMPLGSSMGHGPLQLDSRPAVPRAGPRLPCPLAPASAQCSRPPPPRQPRQPSPSHPPRPASPPPHPRSRTRGPPAPTPAPRLRQRPHKGPGSLR